jgi:ABC-type amino acid transport substrate-binding protein
MLLSFALSTMFLTSVAQAQVKIVVASESWDQLLYVDNRNEPKGVIADFVNAMNQVQNKFRFELSIYPRLRLDKVFMDKEADVYPIRTTLWTDPSLDLLPTKTIFSSGDIFFAKRTNRFGGQNVFVNMKAKNIVGVRGYHYQIFHNNSDESYIKENFNAYLVASNEAVIKFVMADRADIGIVPEVIMAKYLEDPKMRAELIVGDEFDSHVDFSNLVRKDGPISVEEMNTVVDLLIKSGDINKLKERLSVQQYRAVRK